MSKIEVKSASVSFPIYNVNARSFKKQFIRLSTGGMVMEDANHHVVVNALNNISFTLNKGDRVGLIGHNGAGKSTLLRLLAQIYEPVSGEVVIEGHISPMLEIMHGIETELSGYENILTRGILWGLTRKEINEKIQEIAELTDLGDYLHMPIRTYSSGMLVRLAFAISASIKPDILLIDEVFGAGDAAFLEKSRKKMLSLLSQSSIMVMANHSNESIQEFCNKAILLESGQIKYFGAVDTAIQMYHEMVAGACR